MSVRRRTSGRAHYNYFRDYDPAVAGYAESDRIGIWGGYATYAYTLGNPLSLEDPNGLDGMCPVLTFKPTFWSTDERMFNNNCYSYARNRPDGDLAPPGLRLKNMKCPAVIAAALKAGMSRVPANGQCPACTHKVYLLIEAGGDDFHWYRQDGDGTWSHKLADAPIDNKDASRRPIKNPATANSNYGEGNNYSTKCGYLCTPN